MQLACEGVSKMSITIMLQNPASPVKEDSIDRVSSGVKKEEEDGSPLGAVTDQTNKMDISTLLNPAADAQIMMALTAPWEPVLAYRLPPMRMEPTGQVDERPNNARSSNASHDQMDQFIAWKNGHLSYDDIHHSYRYHYHSNRSTRRHRHRQIRSVSPRILPLPSYHSPPPPREQCRSASHGWGTPSYRISEHNPWYRTRVDEYNSRADFDPPEQPHKRSKGMAHSNKAYTREQVDFIRYFKEDCHVSFGNLGPMFMKKFPDTLRDSDQCFSSRYYRANIVPRRDEDGRPVFDDKGKVAWDMVKVRSRSTPEGKELSIPYTLVDMYPWRAVKYDWVSEEHKKVARLILQGIDPTDPSGKKEAWRRLIRECEDMHLL